MISPAKCQHLSKQTECDYYVGSGLTCLLLLYWMVLTH